MVKTLKYKTIRRRESKFVTIEYDSVSETERVSVSDDSLINLN